MSRVTATADSHRSRAESKEKALRNICLPKPQTATMAMGWPVAPLWELPLHVVLSLHVAVCAALHCSHRQVLVHATTGQSVFWCSNVGAAKGNVQRA